MAKVNRRRPSSPHFNPDVNRVKVKEQDIRDININDFITPQLNASRDFARAEKQLEEIINILCDVKDIQEKTIKIPSEFKTAVESYEKDIKQILLDLSLSQRAMFDNLIMDGYQRKDFSQNKEFISVTRAIYDFYSAEIISSTNNAHNITLREIYVFYKSLVSSENEDKNLDDLKKNYSKINQEMLEAASKYKTLVEEAAKLGNKQNISYYAKIYEDEAKSSRYLSWFWLSVGIVLSISFVYGLYCMSIKEVLPTEVIENGKVIYKTSNLLAKTLGYAIVIFVISFCFKQYSVARHNYSINRHRANSLNSYKLYTDSLDEEVPNEIRSELLGYVSKAIYDHQPTGYISEKGQNVNSGIFELTKNIMANKPGQ
ncbi:hypothetical protein [Carboxylicivirga sp. RSCT41]|uniref:hypothetical protein n=1 Tax=Carboxylicivirga agarovorans TaxID=3417570 RepID=UPI003D34A2FA